MKHVLVNFAILFGTIGFIGYLLLILAGFFSCCAGIEHAVFQKIVLAVLAGSAVLFILCMINNCCHLKGRRN